MRGLAMTMTIVTGTPGFVARAMVAATADMVTAVAAMDDMDMVILITKDVMAMAVNTMAWQVTAVNTMAVAQRIWGVELMARARAKLNTAIDKRAFML